MMGGGGRAKGRKPRWLDTGGTLGRQMSNIAAMVEETERLTKGKRRRPEGKEKCNEGRISIHPCAEENEKYQQRSAGRPLPC